MTNRVHAAKIGDMIPTESITLRFWRDAIVVEGGCWGWRGCFTKEGYAQIGTAEWNRGSSPGHRVSWIIHNGPVPTGMQLDHLCRNRWCVNPKHLEVVTNLENQYRAYESRGRVRNKCGGCGVAIDRVIGYCGGCRWKKYEKRYEGVRAARYAARGEPVPPKRVFRRSHLRPGPGVV